MRGAGAVQSAGRRVGWLGTGKQHPPPQDHGRPQSPWERQRFLAGIPCSLDPYWHGMQDPPSTPRPSHTRSRRDTRTWRETGSTAGGSRPRRPKRSLSTMECAVPWCKQRDRLWGQRPCRGRVTATSTVVQRCCTAVPRPRPSGPGSVTRHNPQTRLLYRTALVTMPSRPAIHREVTLLMTGFCRTSRPRKSTTVVFMASSGRYGNVGSSVSHLQHV